MFCLNYCHRLELLDDSTLIDNFQFFQDSLSLISLLFSSFCTYCKDSQSDVIVNLLMFFFTLDLVRYTCHQRLAATRRAGDSPQMLIKSTKVPVTTNLSLEHETPPFG